MDRGILDYEYDEYLGEEDMMVGKRIMEIVEIPNFEVIPPNLEKPEDEEDFSVKCKTCEGRTGWDEKFTDSQGGTFSAWVICGDCEGTGNAKE